MTGTDRVDIDILLTNGRVLLNSGDGAVPSAVALNGPVIVDIGTTEDLTAQYCANRLIDCRGAILHAGLIEPHLHLLSLPFLSMGLDALGTTGLSYSDVKAAMDPEATASFARYAAMRLLQHGFTTVCEPGTAFDVAALADGLHLGGINAMISAPYCWDDIDMFAQSAPGLVSETLLRRVPARTDRCLTALEQALDIADAHDDTVRGFVCLYGLGSASDALIGAAKDLARAHGVMFNLHQDYTRLLREGEIAQHGYSGTQRLDRLGVLDEHTSLTHMVYGSKGDFARITESGAGVIWCPLNILQRGYFRDATHLHAKALRDGVPVGIAADTGLTFPPGATETAAKLLAAGQGTPLASTESLAMQTKDAATCMGLAESVGRLAPGMRADIVIRAPDDPLCDTAGAAAFAGLATSLPVDKVIVSGRVVVENGHYEAGCATEIARDTARHRNRVLEKANG